MRPKLEYLAKDILQVPMAKLGRPLEKCPQLLGYSLEKRIKPRHLLLAKRGLKLGLSRMLAPTDLEFRRILRIHDAQLEEERRSAEALDSVIRAYSPARVAEQGHAEELEEEIQLASISSHTSKSTVRSRRSRAMGVSPLQEVRLTERDDGSWSRDEPSSLPVYYWH